MRALPARRIATSALCATRLLVLGGGLPTATLPGLPDLTSALPTGAVTGTLPTGSLTSTLPTGALPTSGLLPTS